ncbi:hypothetical protein WZ342_2510 [Enterococcus faecalis]|nr:hypothetical protein WZ342_2510 [Enterococcus faecalis]
MTDQKSIDILSFYTHGLDSKNSPHFHGKQRLYSLFVLKLREPLRKYCLILIV